MSSKLIFTGSFEQVLTYVGFTLNLFTFLTVLGLFVFRYKSPNTLRPYKTWGYPVTPAIFLVLNCWFMWYVLIGKPTAAMIGLGVVAIGMVVYIVANRLSTTVEK